ncbi:hypothetical protein GCM10028820_26450 [Tessaracoccus terricola]
MRFDADADTGVLDKKRGQFIDAPEVADAPHSGTCEPPPGHVTDAEVLEQTSVRGLRASVWRCVQSAYSNRWNWLRSVPS